jgi:hypothetical protein
MARSLLLAQFGPAVSVGGSYNWLCTESRPDTHFHVALAAGSEVGLCATIPYGPYQLHAFRERMVKKQGVFWRPLTRSESRGVVPVLTLPVPRAKAIILLTARHHACEATASYVLEGAVDEFLRLRQLGDNVSRISELIAVPMVDIDGVLRGDQGKARLPWDHG